MNKDLFLQYARLKREMRKCENDIKLLQPQVLEQMLNIDGEQTVIELEEGGRFSIAERKTWTFPDSILAEEEQLKDNKKIAMQKGDATFTTKASLIFLSGETDNADY